MERRLSNVNTGNLNAHLCSITGEKPESFIGVDCDYFVMNA